MKFDLTEMSIDRKLILYKSLSTSLLSKGVGFLYQIMALPLLLKYLGNTDFGILAIFMSLVGWIYLLSGGISPYLTRTLASGKPFNFCSNVIAGSRTILIGLTIICTSFFILANTLLPAWFQSYGSTLLLLFCLSIVIVNLAFTDSIRQGKHQQDINNLLLMSANVTTVIFIYICTYLNVIIFSKLFTAVLIIYSPLMLTKLINFSLLQRYGLFERLYIPYKKYKRLYNLIFSFMAANLTIQLSVVAVKSAAIITLGVNDPVDASRMEIVFRYLLILGTFFATIQTVIWPLITQAQKIGDRAWLLKTKLVLAISFFLFGLTTLWLSYYFGEVIFRFWLGDHMLLNKYDITLAALYFFTISLAQAPIIILMGLGLFTFIGKFLAAEAVLYVLIVSLLNYLPQEVSLHSVLIPMIALRFFVFLGLIKRAYYE